VAACVHHFGWSDKDLDQLAGATVAGHLIECGTQVTGGICTDWLDVPDVAHIGFPIVEIEGDGSCIVTKPHGTGGCVTAMTVKEQLVYEIGDPENYVSPDVTASFRSLAVEDLGNDRVQVGGAIGKPRPQTYKISATYRDGFRSAGTLTIIGRDAVAKARRCGELVLERVRASGFDLRDSLVECLGSGDVPAGMPGPHTKNSEQFAETVLRVAVETESREAAERFSRELMPLITAGPQGTTGYAEGRPRVHPVFRYWPCLIARDLVTPHVEILSTPAPRPTTTPVALCPSSIQHPACSIQHRVTSVQHRTSNASVPGTAVLAGIQHPTHLYDIAAARSGDKGPSVNIGVIARSGEWWEFLQSWLTAERVFQHFSAAEVDSVQRFELPNLAALNFVLHGALRRSLRSDAQGKAFGQRLLEIRLPLDAVDERSKKQS
jgi:hypothetical protein